MGLATLVATDEEATADRDLKLRYIFEPASHSLRPLPDLFVTLLVSLDPARPELPSIAVEVPPATGTNARHRTCSASCSPGTPTRGRW